MEATRGCRRCSGRRIIKNGWLRGEQRYRCKDWCYNFVDQPKPDRPLVQKVLAILLYHLGRSFRATGTLCGVSGTTVLHGVDDFAEQHATKPVPPKDGVVVVERDERHHDLKKKSTKLWIWKAYCRDTGPLVDWECGNRDQNTLNRLLDRLKTWKVVLYCTDAYAPDDHALPLGRHFQGKEQTWRLEQNNGRQRHGYRRFTAFGVASRLSGELWSFPSPCAGETEPWRCSHASL